jgi:hypothetical protein
MRATVKNLIAALPTYTDEWIVIKDKQSVKDIILEVCDAHKEFAPYYDSIALYFDDDTTAQICKNIYDFLKSNVRYVEEKEEDQTTALPAGILTRGHGDCKHYSSFAGGVLDAINRLTGKKIKWSYRFASYDFFNSTPHHVFTVVQDNDSEIWIDPTPGAMGKNPVWQIDKKVKVSNMALRRNIAGIGYASADSEIVYVPVDRLPEFPNEQLNPIVIDIIEEEQADSEVTPELQQSIELLLHYGVMNEAAEISDVKMLELSKVLPQEEFNAISQAREIINVEIARDVAMLGGFFSSIWRGVKKVTLALPRNAYLSLVALNAFGYATKLHNAIYNTDGTFHQPSQARLSEKWHKLGGDWNNLKNAIAAGYKKRAVLGYAESVGVAPAIPAWVAVASAIIAAIMPLVKEILNQRRQTNSLPAGIDPNTGLQYGVNPGGPAPVPDEENFFDKIMEWVKQNPFAVAAIAAGTWYFIEENGKRKKRAA